MGAATEAAGEEAPVKKKKKKKKHDLDNLDDAGEDKENEGDISTDPWTGSDRDYQYDELLDRVFGIMRDKNPEMVGGKQKKFVMRPPQVVRVAARRLPSRTLSRSRRCSTVPPSICCSSSSLS